MDRGTTVSQCGHDVALARPAIVSENEEIGRRWMTVDECSFVGDASMLCMSPYQLIPVPK